MYINMKNEIRIFICMLSGMEKFSQRQITRSRDRLVTRAFKGLENKKFCSSRGYLTINESLIGLFKFEIYNNDNTYIMSKDKNFET